MKTITAKDVRAAQLIIRKAIEAVEPQIRQEELDEILDLSIVNAWEQDEYIYVQFPLYMKNFADIEDIKTISEEIKKSPNVGHMTINIENNRLYFSYVYYL